jgi:hypothetical protein
MPTLQAALEAVRAELGEPVTPGAPPETAVPADAGGGEIDDTSSTNAADNVF